MLSLAWFRRSGLPALNGGPTLRTGAKRFLGKRVVSGADLVIEERGRF